MSRLGKWLPPAKPGHECVKPYLWFAKVGQRWMCGKIVDGQPCAKVWRVDADMDGRIWVPDAPEPADTELKMFRPVEDQELYYWIVDDLANQASVDPKQVQQGAELFPVRQVVEAVQRHFEIGKAR